MSKVRNVNFTMTNDTHQLVTKYQAKKYLETGKKIKFGEAVAEIITQNTKAHVAE